MGDVKDPKSFFQPGSARNWQEWPAGRLKSAAPVIRATEQGYEGAALG